ncbi:hypothetical protein GCM10009078_17240 [Cupriavidus gilardii]
MPCPSSSDHGKGWPTGRSFGVRGIIGIPISMPTGVGDSAEAAAGPRSRLPDSTAIGARLQRFSDTLPKGDSEARGGAD